MGLKWSGVWRIRSSGKVVCWKEQYCRKQCHWKLGSRYQVQLVGITLCILTWQSLDIFLFLWAIYCFRIFSQFSSVAQSCLTHGLQHTRLPCPSPTPGACSDSHRALKEIAQSDVISRRQIWVMNPGNMALEVILLTTKVGCLHSPRVSSKMVLCVLYSQLLLEVV